MAKELFLELGTEEIPAGFLPVALRDLERLLGKELESAGIVFEAIKTFATPRRLAIVASGVAEEQPTLRSRAMGPARQIAFGPDGKPSKAGEGFARGQGVAVEDLQIVTTDKGEYVCAEKVVIGRPTVELLPEMLSRVVNGLQFKKSMRWKDLDVRFARPMHWIVALFGGAVVPFEFGNLSSGHLSRGHRFMAREEFAVESAAQWQSELAKRFVMVDQAERRQLIAEGIAKAAAAVGGTVNPDEELLEEVSYLVEDITPLCGSIEARFLQLPRELLITSMREHQRYFTVAGSDGKLLPHFITISNTRPTDPSVVIKGNERVLRARLSDAMFFWQEDQKAKLETRLEALKNVVYQQKLGTSYEKVMRFTALACGLAEQFEPGAIEQTRRAAQLAKCDLETGMVYEFPELQGVMGREYALLEGEDARIATAIFEHYQPTSAGGELPSDNLGAFVSLADKVDTICGCFGVGLIPTGTADPYALRRSAIGILNIILDRGYRLSLPQLIEQSVGLLEAKLNRSAAEVTAEVIEFVRLRFVNMLAGQGYPADVVDAVLAAGFDNPVDALARVKALAALKGREDFEPLAVAFKRVVNIIKGGVSDPVNAGLFEADCERSLWQALQQTQGQVAGLVAGGDYAAALQAIAGLREPVDGFFDGVMVMAEDAAVKTNRLALLTGAAGLFKGIADFSRIAD
jgi:glycyl-tRNA synthetase beta chain